MSHELKEGTRLQAVTFPGGDGFEPSRVYVDGETICITVREQTGQMSMVPWVRIERKGKPDWFANCALLESVEFLP